MAVTPLRFMRLGADDRNKPAYGEQIYCSNDRCFLLFKENGYWHIRIHSSIFAPDNPYLDAFYASGLRKVKFDTRQAAVHTLTVFVEGENQ